MQGSGRAGGGDETSSSSSNSRDSPYDLISTDLGSVGNNVHGNDVNISSSSSSSNKDTSTNLIRPDLESVSSSVYGSDSNSSSGSDFAAHGATASSSTCDVVANGSTNNSSISSSSDLPASVGNGHSHISSSSSSSSSGDVAASDSHNTSTSSISNGNCATYSDQSVPNISEKEPEAESAPSTSLPSSPAIRAAAMTHLKSHVKASGDHWVMVQCGNWEKHPLGWTGPAVAVLQLWHVGGHMFDYSLWVVDPSGVVTGEKYYSLTGEHEHGA